MTKTQNLVTKGLTENIARADRILAGQGSYLRLRIGGAVVGRDNIEAARDVWAAQLAEMGE